MKKKLIFCICMILCVVLCAGTVPFSAFTYDCSVDVTSAAVLVANLETDTFVYEKNANTARYLSYLTNIMTFIVARNNVADIDERLTVKAEVLDSIEDPDNTLDKYINHTLTVRDLLHFIIMQNGKDACYVLADYVTDGDIPKFIELMNQKARELGCTKTNFISVAGVKDQKHYTTCADMYKIVKCALNTPDYTDIASTTTYMPDGYKNQSLEVETNNSLLRSTSPYYFKHVKNGKYAADALARGNVVAVSKYSDVSYACIVLGSQVLSEHNCFTETKQLLTWAYTRLGNKQIISENEVLATVTANTAWGESTINLTAGEDVVRTMPADYSSSQLTCVYDSTKLVQLPIYKGQNMGTAKVYFDGTLFDEIDLISDSSSGVSMLEDLGSFVSSMYNSTIIAPESVSQSESVTESSTEPSTQPVSIASTDATQSTQAGQ